MRTLSTFLAGSTIAVLGICSSSIALAATLTVGPGKTYEKPCEAIAAAQDGDTIEVDAGSYDDDTCAWSTDNLTVRGVGGRAKIQLKTTQPVEKKGIFTIHAPNATIENFELSGAAISEGAGANGAGIRHQGLNLTVRNCFFHDNQDGILGGPMANGADASGQGEVLIENSEFLNNGYASSDQSLNGKAHNIYINAYAKFTLRGSWSHKSIIGHLVKTRAHENYILYNRITGEDGTGSYEIDVPQGGKTYIIANLIQQGTGTDNPSIIAYSEEGAVNPLQELYVVNNTIVNDRANASDKFVWIANATTAPAVLRNNIFMGAGTVCINAQSQPCQTPDVVDDHNFVMPDAKLVNAAAFDYHLLASSPCVDAGTDPGSAGGQSLVPQYQYLHPASFETRSSVGTIDIGAYELGGGGGAGGGGTGGGTTSSSSSSSGVASSSSGGTTTTGGGNGGNGAGGEGGADGGGEESGCGCRAVGGSGNAGAAVLLGALGALMMRRRRERR